MTRHMKWLIDRPVTRYQHNGPNISERSFFMKAFCPGGKVVLSGLLFFVTLATAQTDTGSVGGFVKDPSGGVVPQAKVTVKNEGTNETHSLTTDNAGYYIAPNLPPGYYTMVVEAAGFKRFESVQNRLAPNTALSLD